MKNKPLLLFIAFISLTVFVVAQNTVVTDSANYNGGQSAILDVQSVHKGFLAPRMTTSQRNGISSPADGLLVYDVSENAFYVYSPSGWEPLSSETLWMINNDSVYVTGNGDRVGVGTKSPMGRFIIQGDATAVDEPLFEVKNSDGYSIFAVYEDSVAINFIEGTKGVKGGFAVGGLTPGKDDPVEYLKITPHNVRVSIDTSSVKGVKGGFAVGGLTPGKSDTINYFHITPDSARVYLREQSKGVKGGFAVGGLTPGKGITDHYLTIERDSTRIYVDNSSKGVKGGFAVGGLTPGKAVSNSFMSLTPENYLIGHRAGEAIDTGKFNAFFGYEAGVATANGNENIFIGYKSGHGNQGGNKNTFMGYEAGYSNSGSDNTFIGNRAGASFTTQGGNVFIGSKAGESATNGEQNIFIGESSGNENASGSYNVFMGYQSGYQNSVGVKNIFIGHQAGYNNIGHTSQYGANNVFIGTMAGFNNRGSSYQDWASNNVFIGTEAGFSNVSGPNNVFIGTGAGHNNVGDVGEQNDGARNVFVGTAAGYLNQSGYSNVYIGDGVSYNNLTGYDNVIIGKLAADNPSTGNENTIIGKEAGKFLNGGSQNVFIGADAAHGDISVHPGSGNIIIGYGAGYNETGSYRFIVQSGGFYPLLYGVLNTGALEVSGSLTIKASSTSNSYTLPEDRGAATQVLTTAGDGTTSWSAAKGLSAENSFDNLYSGTFLKKKASYYSVSDMLEIVDQISFNPGTNEKIDMASFPGKLKESGALKIGETTVLNLQLNKLHHNQIKNLADEVEALKKENKELRVLIESLMNEK